MKKLGLLKSEIDPDWTINVYLSEYGYNLEKRFISLHTIEGNHVSLDESQARKLIMILHNLPEFE